MKKSNTIMTFLVGVSLTVAALSLSGQLNLDDTAKAEISRKTTVKPYTPMFYEWVHIWANVHMNYTESDYFIASRIEQTNKGIRWKITLCLFANITPTNKNIAMRLWKDKKKALQEEINKWRRFGYDISSADFTMIVKQL